MDEPAAAGTAPRAAAPAFSAPALAATTGANSDRSAAAPPPPATSARAESAAEPGTTPITPNTAVTAARLAPQQQAPDRAKRLWMEPIGVAALLSAGMALLCALTYSLSSLVIVLSAASLLLGLLSLLRYYATDAFRAVIPIAGAAAGGLVLLTALLVPSMLGPSYLAYRARKAEDLTTIRVIPLLGDPSGAPANPDWVDASRAALQQGRLRVQIVSVLLGTDLPDADPPEPAAHKKAPPGELLFIRLRIQQTVEMSADRGQDAPAVEQVRFNLTDNAGKDYRRREVRETTAADKGRKPFPTALVDQVLAFEAPPADVAYLRLELPAAAWGGSGLFRFTIPNAMIRRADASGDVPGG
jgi:hypothetical protein